jgi:hypothetical protein
MLNCGTARVHKWHDADMAGTARGCPFIEIHAREDLALIFALLIGPSP